MCVLCIPMLRVGTCGIQKKALDLRELGYRNVSRPTWELGTEHWFSVSSLDFLTVEPSLQPLGFSIKVTHLYYASIF